ncbi:hypothetical protein Trydic_g12699 [Trypoxylus dichotomus]
MTTTAEKKKRNCRGTAMGVTVTAAIAEGNNEIGRFVSLRVATLQQLQLSFSPPKKKEKSRFGNERRKRDRELELSEEEEKEERNIRVCVQFLMSILYAYLFMRMIMDRARVGGDGVEE